MALIAHLVLMWLRFGGYKLILIYIIFDSYASQRAVPMHAVRPSYFGRAATRLKRTENGTTNPTTAKAYGS